MEPYPKLSHKVYVHLVDDELILGGIDVQIAPQDTSVVYQYVHWTHVFFYALVQNFNPVPFGNITFVADGRASCFVYHPCRFVVFLFGDVHAHDFCAQFSKPIRDFTAHSSSGTSDLQGGENRERNDSYIIFSFNLPFEYYHQD